MDIKQIAEQLKPAPGVKIAKGMENMLDEKNSRWRFSMTISNYLTSDKRIVLLTGGIPQNRIQQLKPDGAHVIYVDVEGSNNPSIDGVTGDIILIPDFPEEINYATQLKADIVATNFIQNFLPQKTLINGLSSSFLSFDSISNNGTLDDFREFLKHNPIKIVKTQITSNAEQQFASNIIYGQYNPLERFQQEIIGITDYYEANANRKKVIIPKDIYIDANTVYALDVPSLAVTTLTWIFASTFNTGEYFKSKNKYETTIKSIMKK